MPGSQDELLNLFNEATERQEQVNWDDMAEKFWLAKRSYGDQLQRDVALLMQKKGLLRPDDSLVDVGCGFGRYALVFGTLCRSVVACDVSRAMVEKCGFLAEHAGLSNLSAQVFDVCTDQGEKLGAPFDVAFCSMCDACCTPQGIRQFMALSSRFCVVLRYCGMEDRHLPVLRTQLGISRSDDPHEGRHKVHALFNWLWHQGYAPSIAWLSRREEKDLSLADALARYSLSVGKAAAKQGVALESLIAPLAHHEVVSMKNETSVALLIWPLEERFWHETAW